MLYLSTAVLMLMFFSAVPMYHASEGMQDLSKSPITQPQPAVYINGDWNVTTDTVRSNETIILNGNLTVESGATLTFRNVTLIVNSSSTRDYRIEVKRGATMIISDWDNDNTTAYDGSNITAADANYGLLFWVRDGSNFSMNNSELHRCGGWALQAYDPVALTYGLYIATDNATIDHNLISNNYMGVVLYGSDATVSNNTITWNNDTGIYAGYWSNGTIENNWITWNYKYGIWVTGGGSTGTKPSNPTIINNTLAHTGQDLGAGYGDGIHITYASNPIIKNTQILSTGEDAVYSADNSTPTLINVTIDGANYGIASSSTRYIYIYNMTVVNANTDFSIADSYFVVTNTMFNKSNVYISNEYSNLTVRWYLHVYVEDSNHQPISGADVRVRDNENGTYDKNFSTDSNGYVKWIVLTEYWQNNTTKIYYTPYNITVNYTGLNFSDNPRDTNMNASKTEIFTATTSVPEFPSIVYGVLGALLITVVISRRKRKGERRNGF